MHEWADALTLPSWYLSSEYLPVAMAALGARPWLIEYTLLKESTYTLRFDKATSEHGWKVAASHPAAASKLWIEARTVLESIGE